VADVAVIATTQNALVKNPKEMALQKMRMTGKIEI
jgi:hypothetical protein